MHDGDEIDVILMQPMDSSFRSNNNQLMGSSFGNNNNQEKPIDFRIPRGRR